MDSYTTVPNLHRKKPRGFVYQVYLALKPNLGGYRGKPVYHRVDGIIKRVAGTNKRIDDLLKYRRNVDIVRLALKLMEQNVFKDENIAFELYPQLDPDNDQFDDFDENCSDEEYIIPSNKAEPRRKPFDLAFVTEKIKPKRNTMISQKYVQPLSVRSKIALITTPTSIIVTTSLPEIRRISANENRPPIDVLRNTTINSGTNIDLNVLPPRTQATVINRLVWIMQMACFEFLGFHKESLLVHENIAYADSTTLRYYAVLIHSVINHIPQTAMLEPYLLGNDNDKANKIDRLLYPLLQLQAEMTSINKLTRDTLKDYYDILEPMCKALKSRRGKRIKNLEEITEMLFGRRAEEHLEAYQQAEARLASKIKPARAAAEKEPNERKRSSRLFAIEKEEKTILSDLIHEEKAIETRYNFNHHEQMFVFFDKIDDSSTSLNRRVTNIHALEDDDFYDAAADSD
ncbi:hypothetical protein Dda_1477 [Drechslerella dactyloides]|uniref:Uncharacterized protein n=1 Tax=Drechslerella dactyloides TaxID=74499 RepID=A0AAD6J1T1_DREDA|nr:hypothetical protein Dda_1477 [Drechslerella dactyloides]